ncbi:MAG: helix-turn-helix domain-containing protein [Bryobacteraceae bacterium]
MAGRGGGSHFETNFATRRTVIRSPGVRVIRERTSLSQSEFARLIGVSVKTLQNWEQHRRRPTGPAAVAAAAVSHRQTGGRPRIARHRPKLRPSQSPFGLTMELPTSCNQRSAPLR